MCGSRRSRSRLSPYVCFCSALFFVGIVDHNQKSTLFLSWNGSVNYYGLSVIIMNFPHYYGIRAKGKILRKRKVITAKHITPVVLPRKWRKKCVKKYPVKDEFLQRAEIDIWHRKRVSYSSIQYFIQRFLNLFNEGELHKLKEDFAAYQFDAFS